MNALFIPLLLIGQTTASNTTVVQISHGWCSPNISQVIGDVSITCIGVDPRALVKLNSLLAKRNLQLKDRIAAADAWADKYHELERSLENSNDALAKKAQDYLQQGDLDKAGELLDQMAPNEEKEIDQIAQNRYERALIFELNYDIPSSLPLLAKAYQYRPDVWIYANAYGRTLLIQNAYSLALQPLQQALRIARASAINARPETQRDVVISLNLLAALHRDTRDPSDSELEYKESISLLRELAKENPEEYLAELAQTLNSRAKFCAMNGNLTETEQDLAESYAIYKSLVAVNRRQYLGEMAGVVSNISNYYDSINKPEDAEAGYKLALSIRQELATDNPSAYLPDLAETLNNIGSFYLGEDRFGDAIPPLAESIEIYQKLASAEPSRYKPNLSQALNNLGVLYRKNGAPCAASINSRRFRWACPAL